MPCLLHVSGHRIDLARFLRFHNHQLAPLLLKQTEKRRSGSRIDGGCSVDIETIRPILPTVLHLVRADEMTFWLTPSPLTKLIVRFQ